MPPKVTITIATYNNRETIKACLLSIFREQADLPSEVVLIDNASGDGTADLVATDFPQVRLIRNKENVGLAKALNQGIRRSKAAYILMLNPDTALRRGGLKSLVAFAEANPKVGIVGPELLFPNGGVQREVQRFPTLWPMVFWLFRLHRVFPFSHLPPLRGFLLKDFDYGKTQEAEHLMGAALLLRRKMLNEIGLLDEKFWLWFEETDLEKRARDAGWKVIYYPGAKVSHMVGKSTRQLNPFRLQYVWNSALRYYFKKHRPLWEQILLEPFFWLSYLPIPIFFIGKKLSRR